MTGASSCCLLPWWGTRSRLLAASEDLDDAHRTAAGLAWLAQREWYDLGAWRIILFGRFRSEHCADFCDCSLAACTGQKSVMANAVQAVGQHMDKKAADELVIGQPHDHLTVTVLASALIRLLLEIATQCV